MTQRKKVTILILAVLLLAIAGSFIWAWKAGKIKPRADVAGALVPMPINLKAINPPPQSFDDVPPTHWAYKYVEGVARNGLTLGCTSNLEQTTGISKDYCPDMNTSMRQQVATFAVRQFLRLNPSAPICRSTADCPLYYKDVDYNYAYGQIIQTARRNGLTRYPGWEGQNFYPDNPVTRSEIASIIYSMSGNDERPPDDPDTCMYDWNCYINRAQMAGYFATNFDLTFQPWDADAPVLLDWDEPQPSYDPEDQDYGYEIWRQGPNDTAPQLVYIMDAPEQGLDRANNGGNYFDQDFPANFTGKYTYYIYAFDNVANYSQPATLSLSVKSGS